MNIEVSLPSNTGAAVIGAMLVLLLGLGGLGFFVTPLEAGEPVLLTPERWAALTLARQARRETTVLQRDLAQLSDLLHQEHPDPVTAMLLAEGIYARHRTGASATAPARKALITATAQTARYASGSLPYGDALAAYEIAVTRLRTLEASSDDLAL